VREAVIRKAGAVVLAGTDHAGVTRAVLQAALDAEMTGHLGHDEGERLAIPAGTHQGRRDDAGSRQSGRLVKDP
jgi:transposase-like protein